MNELTIDDFVRREVIQNVSCLVSDLMAILPNVSNEVLRHTSFDENELGDLCQRPNYEAAADSHIDDMDRDDLISALEDADVEDERDEHTIAVALGQYHSSPDYDPEIDDETPDWVGLDDKVLRHLLKAHLADENDGYKDFVEKHNIDYYYIDAYEHWAVTDWFAARLREKGEIVGDVSNLTVWGRTTTGQAISMDWVVQEIYKELME